MQTELPDLQDQMGMLEASAFLQHATMGDVTQAAAAAEHPEPEAAEVLAAQSGSVQQQWLLALQQL